MPLLATRWTQTIRRWSSDDLCPSKIVERDIPTTSSFTLRTDAPAYRGRRDVTCAIIQAAA
jgi:hypothetical protein